MERKYLVDFDGVILDSQDRFLIDMKDNINPDDWMIYLNSLNWYNFIRECSQIDESLSVLEQLQRLKKLKAIITSIHSLEEQKEKTLFLRENKIIVPIISVGSGLKKSDVYIPNIYDTLVDDKKENCEEWILAGGSAILFDSHANNNEKDKIKSLKQLL